MALEASEAVATRFIEAITSEFDRLLAFPLSGPSREQLGPDLRAAFHGAYVIYYQSSGPDLIIVRVLHGARDLTLFAERGGFKTER